jgi:prepilin-type N-terminal cleavage/methylation domain-containing protein
MNSSPLHAAQPAGFTLVEVLLALVLTGVMMALTAPFLHLQKRLWEREEAAREAERSLAGALSWVTRDLQQAGYHVPGAPLRRLETAAIGYVLSRDEDAPDGFAAANRRLVTLYLDGGDLKYRIQTPLPSPAEGWESGSVQVLAPGIAEMSCGGLDAGGAPAAAPERAVLVSCRFTTDGGAQAATSVRLRTAPGGGP